MKKFMKTSIGILICMLFTGAFAQAQDSTMTAGKRDSTTVGSRQDSSTNVSNQTNTTSVSNQTNTTSVSNQDNSMTISKSSSLTGKRVKVGIAANLGVPLTSGYKIAFGGDLQVDIPLAESFFITASGGYENFSYKAFNQGGVSFQEGNTNFIPVLAGLKYYFSDKFYGHAQAGYTFSTTKGGGGAFTFAPGIGYDFSKNFDASVKYVNMSKTNSGTGYGGVSIGTLQLRLAYDF